MLAIEGSRVSTDSSVIVAIARTPVGKAPKGSLRLTRPDDLAAQALSGVLERAQPLRPEDVDDVILGCAIPKPSKA